MTKGMGEVAAISFGQSVFFVVTQRLNKQTCPAIIIYESSLPMIVILPTIQA